MNAGCDEMQRLNGVIECRECNSLIIWLKANLCIIEMKRFVESKWGKKIRKRRILEFQKKLIEKGRKLRKNE